MEKLHLLSSGIVTALGASAKTTAAAVKAGVSAYQNSSHIGRQRTPFKMAKVPSGVLPALIEPLQNTGRLSTRERHLIKLATPALASVLDDVGPTDTLPCFIAGPEPMPGCRPGISEWFVEALACQNGIQVDRANSRVFATGRAGGFQAIAHAFHFLANSSQDKVLVGGVDSFDDMMLLAKLDAEDRILFSGNAQGFAPGEAAGFLLLGKTPAKHSHTAIFAPGQAMEKGHRYSDQPYRGDGLAQAVTHALQCPSGNHIRKIFSSMNGESYFSKELGVAMARNAKAFTETTSLQHPADAFGDIGAACAAVFIALISQEAPGHYLAYGSSDGPYRAAICIEQRSA